MENPTNPQGPKTFNVTKGARLEEGSHTGTIVRVEFRTPPEYKFDYTDIFIAVDGWNFEDQPGELKYGVATNFTVNSQLVQLMSVFGKEVNENDLLTEEDVKNVFINKRVKFVVFDKAGKDKNGKPATYSNIVVGSLKKI